MKNLFKKIIEFWKVTPKQENKSWRYASKEAEQEAAEVSKLIEAQVAKEMIKRIHEQQVKAYDMKPIADTMTKAINDLQQLTPVNATEDKESQNKQILKHLKQGKTLTSLQALQLFGCARCASRIHDLRSFGFNITTNMIIKNGKRIAEYKLEA